MIKLRDIRSLTDFQRNTRAYLRRLKQSRSPTVLTVNGKAELIIQDAEAFEEMLDSIRGIQRGLDEMKAGAGDPADQVLRRIRTKQNIPHSPR
jgi:PHD/YefM family antitoxin component YafN of YafNO toxin-antitoxin module